MLLFSECEVLHMLAYEDVGHVGGLVPSGLAGHVVADERAVDGEVLEADVLHLALLVVSRDDAHVGLLPAVGDVAEGDVLDAAARS